MLIEEFATVLREAESQVPSGKQRARAPEEVSGQKRPRRSEIVGGDAIQVTTATDPARLVHSKGRARPDLEQFRGFSVVNHAPVHQVGAVSAALCPD